MNGIEKINRQILADAQAEADEILQAARREADAIAADFDARVLRESQEAAVRNEAAAIQREERLASVAALEARKQILAARQEMVTKAFDLALEKLCTLPRKEYTDLLARMAAKAARTGQEEVILSEKDQKEVGSDVVKGANDLLGKGKLTLSKGTASIRGGLLLTQGDTEVNCSFETLIRLAREELSGQVADLLFQ